MIKKYFLCSFFLFAIIMGCQKKQQWIQWRGPNTNGTIQYANWNPKALDNGAKTVWNAEVGKGHSAVAVAENRLVAFGNKPFITGQDTVEKDMVFCFNANSGEEIWQYEYPCESGGWPGPCATPVVDDNRVYTLSREGHLFCFDIQDGGIIWQKNLVSDSLTRSFKNHIITSSPVITEELLLLNLNKSGIAFNKMSGDLVWSSEIKQSNFGTPVLMEHNGIQYGLFFSQRKIHAVEILSGERLWSHQVGWGDADPIIMGDHFLFTGQHTGLYKFDPTGPKEVWKNKDLSWQFQSAVVIDSCLYGLSGCDWDAEKQPLTCVDIETGDVKWKEYFEMWGALIAINNEIVFLDVNGKLHIVESSPESYQIISSAQAVPMADNTNVENQDQCACWTNPVFADGKLFLRNNFGTVVCLDVS